MKKLSSLFVAILTLSSLPSFAETPQAMPLTYSPRCILEATITKMRAKVKEEAPLPTLYPASQTSFEKYLEVILPSVGPNSGIQVYINFYVASSNSIVVNDTQGSVGVRGRTSDDVLAHELAHYVQSQYKGYDIVESTSDPAEEEAIWVQTWFRESFMQGKKSDVSPCPITQSNGLDRSTEWKF